MSAAPLLLVGAGGHAVACIDVIERHGVYSIAGMVGLPREVGKQVLGYSVIGTDSDLQQLRRTYSHAAIGIGQIKSADARVDAYERLTQLGYALPILVSPRAYVSPHARMGVGTIVFHGATINAGAVVGSNCVVNSHALIEHDAVVEDHTHVATGAIVNGSARIGPRTFLGSRSVVREGVSVGARSFIGMGVRVMRDCPDQSKLLREGEL